MLNYTRTFSSFSVNDLGKAKAFYEQVLGIPVKETPQGLSLFDNTIFVYPKSNHEPATFTVLNLQVADIDAAVDELNAQGVRFLHYEGDMGTDAKGIARDPRGPQIAWFKDPADNFMSVLQV
jgi:predicted enzyme related to lactoylglutathione lyase